MKRRTLTIALAALLAMLGTVAVLAYVHQANDRAVAGLRAEAVIIAKATIPSGTSLRDAQDEHLLTTERVPIASVPSDAVLSVTDKNEGLVLNSPVQPGQLVLEPMLETAAQVTGGVAIPKGFLAVSIQVCIPAAVAGYLTAGSDVAVFDTFPVGTGKSSSSLNLQESCAASHQTEAIGSVATEMVIPRVQVLSVSDGAGGQASSGNGSAFADSSSSAAASNGTVTVTLAVSQADAERLIEIAQVGLPYLALLTPSSSTSFDSGPVPLFRSGS